MTDALHSIDWRDLFQDLEPLVRRKLRAVFTRDRFKATVRRATALRHFLDRLQPDLIVDSDGIRVTAVATDWAASTLEIPRLKILHYDEQLFRMSTLISTRYWDRAAVMGPAPQAALMQMGLAADKIVQAGYPFFDRRLSQIRQSAGIPRQVLFTAQGLPEEAAVFARIIEAFAQLPEYRLIARVHPLEPRSLDELLRVPRPNVARAPRQSLYESIASCVLVMTISSITALEAVLMGKPVLVLEPRPGHPHNPSLFYVRHGVGRQIFELDQLSKCVRELCEGSLSAAGRNEIMEGYFPVSDATQRLEAYIRGLITR